MNKTASNGIFCSTFITAFRFNPCDADCRYGPVLTSPVAIFHNNSVIRVNASFPFDEVNRNTASLNVYMTTVLGHVDYRLASIQPPQKRSYDVASSGTVDGFYMFDICLPSGTFGLAFIGFSTNYTMKAGLKVRLSLATINSITAVDHTLSCITGYRTNQCSGNYISASAACSCSR